MVGRGDLQETTKLLEGPNSVVSMFVIKLWVWGLVDGCWVRIPNFRAFGSVNGFLNLTLTPLPFIESETYTGMVLMLFPKLGPCAKKALFTTSLS